MFSRSSVAQSVLGAPRKTLMSNGIAFVHMVRKSAPGNTLTRAALREAVYSCCTTLSRSEARKILDATFEEISEALLRGESVKLRSFGTFNVRSKRERIGRNPKTGVEAKITPRRVLTFKASPVLVAHVNGDAIIPEED
jgi:integration host factor subunit alpha